MIGTINTVYLIGTLHEKVMSWW